MSGTAHAVGRHMEQAKRAVLTVLAFVMIATVIVAGYSLHPFRETTRSGRTYVRVLHLETPALVPSGRSFRNPGYLSPSVDLRPTPLLPIALPNPETLLFTGRQPDPAMQRCENR